MIPRRLGTSGSVRASSTPNSERWAQVFHTFWPVTSQSSPSRSARVASEARSEPAPGSLNSWHHRSSLRTMRREVAQPLVLGAVGEEGRGGQVEPERVEAAQVVDRQARPPPPGPRRGSGRARRTRGARWRRPDRSHRTPGTRPRSRRGCAPSGSPPPPRRPPPRRQLAGHVASHPLGGPAGQLVVGHPGGQTRRRPVAGAHQRPLKPGGASLAERGQAFPEVLAARGELEGEPLVAELLVEGGRAPGVQQPLGEPERHRGPVRQCGEQLGHRAGSTRRTAPRGGRGPTPAASVPASSRPSSSSSRARGSPTSRGSSQVAPLSGVKPRALKGSQNRASSAATVKSAASANWNPMPAAQP